MEEILVSEELMRHTSSSASQSTMYANGLFGPSSTTSSMRPQTSMSDWGMPSLAIGASSPSQVHNARLSSDPFQPQASSPQSQSTGTRVLTRRQRAAVARASEPSQVFAMDPLFHPSMYGIHPHSVSPTPLPLPNLNLSANPADISPPARRAHSRHTSLASSSFDHEPLHLTPSSTFSGRSNAFERASSPASSIASSSIASLSGSVSHQSHSTWSSTNGSSPARIVDPDEVSSSLSVEDGSPHHKEKHTKHKLTNSSRREICAFAEKFPCVRQEDIAARFGVERSTVSKVLKNKARWLSLDDDDDELLKKAKHRPIKFPAIENDVLAWVQERTNAGETVSDATLRDQARLAAKRHGIADDQFKASGGWIENFKTRNRIRKGKIQPARSERGYRILDEDRASVSSSIEDGASAKGAGTPAARLALSPEPRNSASPPVASNGSEHGYQTRSKTMNPFQLQASVGMMRDFIHEVYPEGFTEEHRELWDAIEQRTMKWAMKQMQGE